ncbi:hypothetical protein V6Z12_D13G267700 [Gossypium hirsutum]
MSGSQAADQLLKQSLQQQQQNQQSLNRQLLFSMAPGDDCHRFALAEPRSIADQEAEAMVVKSPLKRKSDVADREVEPGEWTLPRGYNEVFIGLPQTPVLGKGGKAQKTSRLAKSSKFGPQTPPSNLGSPGNNLTPAGPCRYDSSLGLLTKKFINLIKQAEDGILDLNKAAGTLEAPFWPFRSNFVKDSSLMKQPECKMGEGEDKELKDSSLMKQPECNKGEGEGEDKELKDSSLMKQPECNKGEGEGEGEDKELKEDDISQDSDCFSGLSNYKPVKRWHYVRLEKTCQRNEQVALLLKVLKCDKSVIPSIYDFRSVYFFHAYLTLDEAENLSELEEVEEVGFPMSEVPRKAKRTRSRTSNGLLKAKKQKTSMGSILSQRRQNKEKWRYNEDFEPEPESDIKGLEEDDLSEDDLLDDYGSSCRYEGYYGFDASGKRGFV